MAISPVDVYYFYLHLLPKNQYSLRVPPYYFIKEAAELLMIGDYVEKKTFENIISLWLAIMLVSE